MNAEIIQKKFYSYIKKKAQQIELAQTPELKNYEANFLKINSSKYRLSSEAELKKKMLSSSVIYVGDFHTFDQNSKNLERLLKSLHGLNKKIIFGFEFIHQSDQIYIDHYLNNHLSEIEFLESINYSESWKFPWTHYRIFFEWAKRGKSKNTNAPLKIENILALNSRGSLKKRDINASQKIYSALLNIGQLNNYIFIVFFGEMHLAKNKLPHLVSKECEHLKNRHFSQLIIHQNLDSFYWKLNQKKIKTTQSQIIKFNSNEYCILSSPPWIKYESLLYWYEHLEDDPNFDLHEHIRENGKKNIIANDSDVVMDTVKKLCQCFGLKKSTDDLNYNLNGPLHLKGILKNIYSLPKFVSPVYSELLYKGLLFRIPGTFNFFSSSYSVNKVAAASGMIISHFYSEEIDKTHETLFAKKEYYKDSLFYLLLKENFLAECCKLIYNPYAKCDLYLDFKFYSKDSKTPRERKKAYFLAIDLLDDKYNLKRHTVKSLSRAAVLNSKIFAYYLYNYRRKYMKEVIQHILNNSMPDTYSIHQYLKNECLKDIDYKTMSKKRF